MLGAAAAKPDYTHVETNATPGGVRVQNSTNTVVRSEVSLIRSFHIASTLADLSGLMFLWFVADGTHSTSRGIVYWTDDSSLVPQVKVQSGFPQVAIAFSTLALAVCIKALYIFSTQRDSSSISMDLAQRYWPRTCFEASALNVLAYSLIADACKERDSTKQAMTVCLLISSNVYQWVAESVSRDENPRSERSAARIMLGFSFLHYAVAWGMLFHQMGLSYHGSGTSGSTWERWSIVLPIAYAIAEAALLSSTATRVENVGYEYIRVCIETVIRSFARLALCLTIGQS